MKRRPGFSLLELLMVIMVGSVLLGLSAGLLHALLKVDRSGRAHLAGLAREARLAHLFRLDVRAAHRGWTVDKAGKLALDLGDDHTVEYVAQGKELHRVERMRDAVRNQDAFALPRDGAVRFDIEPRGPITVVRLAIERAPATVDSVTRRATQIESVLAQDHRFANSEK
jgi:prepilin-type N-terminal cleavage/methylation domain-containing protein